MYKYKLIFKKPLPKAVITRLLKTYDGEQIIDRDKKKQDKLNMLIKHFEQNPNDTLHTDTIARKLKVSSRTASRYMQELGDNNILTYKTIRDDKGVLKGFIGKKESMIDLMIKLQPKDD